MDVKMYKLRHIEVVLREKIYAPVFSDETTAQSYEIFCKPTEPKSTKNRDIFTTFAFMKTESPIITIVIPVFNREKIILPTLKSISEQNRLDFKVIIVDNNSTDGTRTVLDAWAAEQSFSVSILCESTKGAAAARQCGLNAVDTEWTLFFDSDDTMRADNMARVIEAIDANPDADMISWSILEHNCFNGRTAVKPGVHAIDQYDSFFHGTTATLRYCARTELFRRAGGWDRTIGVWDDIELGARILALQPALVALKGSPTIDVYLQHDSLTTGESITNIEMIERVLNRISTTLGSSRSHWIDLKLMLIAAHAPSPDAEALRDRILSRTTRPLLLRLAYHYTRVGGRGFARIFKPLLK